MKIVTYNLNGIRAAHKLGVLDWVMQEDADIYCFQEVRADEPTCRTLFNGDLTGGGAAGYHLICNCGERAGYSGTAVLTKRTPDRVEYGLNDADPEGRTITMWFGDTVIVNSYVPNGTSRLEFKLEYFDRLTAHLADLARTHHVILCSDTNIAHTENDVSHPRENSKRSGYLPVERARLSTLLSRGFIDTYRALHPTGKAYSWRSYRSRTVGGDFGWKFRFDYIITNTSLPDTVTIQEAPYSDHLPVMGVWGRLSPPHLDFHKNICYASRDEK